MQAAEIPASTLTYRLYHDKNGLPLCYSMEVLEGQYIEITQEQFNKANSHVVVVNGKLVEKHMSRPKLVPSDNSGYKCHIHNVALIQTDQQPHTKWDLKYHD